LDSNFLSLDEALLTAPRKPDSSLPDTNFMRMAGENNVGVFARP
jgi:hypothetical protein